MSQKSLGLRLLELQKEFFEWDKTAGVAREFNRPDWGPRAVDVIAADYEATLRELAAQ